MSKAEFKAWPKIGRETPFRVTITEKLDGTNACIIIQDNKIVGIQSRNRFIEIGDDNFGFAGWVWDNAEELIKLGEGYHYGEWVGVGIQKNPHNLPDRQFFLFNTFRWNSQNPNLPSCCKVVPILFEGNIEADTIKSLLQGLVDNAGETTPEGIIVYYHSSRSYSKHTIKAPNGKWAIL